MDVRKLKEAIRTGIVVSETDANDWSESAIEELVLSIAAAVTAAALKSYDKR